jgi:ABC-2 type transport system ATP-binding protein
VRAPASSCRAAEPVIDVQAVYKSFDSVEAVRGVDLRIMEGQFTAILGPNGAGKTTLVEMIEGIQQPDEGSIRITELPWRGNEDALHRIMGISLQETRFVDRLTVFETIRLFAGFYDLDNGRVGEIIDMTGLGEKRDAYVVELSGGQRQRLALGLALLNHPAILILDEPTTGLDPNARREIWSILLALKKKCRTSLVLTTHYMEEAEQLCDRIVIIDGGKILAQGSLDQLLENHCAGKIIAFSLEPNVDISDAAWMDGPFAVQWDPVQKKGSFEVTQIENDLPAFMDYLKARQWKLKDMECRRKTLDDLFISMTGRRLNE